MLTIIYDPNHKPSEVNPQVFSPTDGEINKVADEIEKTIKVMVKEDSFSIIITNFLLIIELRARIAEKKIDYQKIQFKFNNEIVKHDENARFVYCPRGFGDTNSSILMRILNPKKC